MEGHTRWRLIRDGKRDGATQLALEEAAAHTARTEGIGTVRVYGWDPSTLSLGYAQDPETVDWAYCEDAGIQVTRRQTGGGGIYHDTHGDVAYTIVAPAAVVPSELMACYESFCTPILEALATIGVDADFAARERPALFEPACYLRDVHPAHDIVHEGRKVSGNAQYRQRDVVIQHGSITYALEPERPLGAFAGHGLTPVDVRERVTDVRAHASVDREELRTAVADALQEWCGANPGEWSSAEHERADRLVEEKYGATAWVSDRAAPLRRR